MNWRLDYEEQGSLIFETMALVRAYHEGGPKALADRLEEIVRSGHLPEQAVSFVADVLRGNVTRPKGAPTKEIDNKLGAAVVELVKRRKGMNRKRAVYLVAKANKVGERTVQRSLARYDACAEEFFKRSGLDIRK